MNDSNPTALAIETLQHMRARLHPQDGAMSALKAEALDAAIDALSKLRAPVAGQAPIQLSAEVLDYLKEGIESATQCEEADVDHDFAHELARLMQGPLYSAPVGGEAVAWENFPAYLIDHCEGDTITEEGLQHALSKMLADPKYAAPQASEAVRDAALEEAAAMIGGHTWAGASEEVSRLIARHVRALKSQSALLSAQPGAQEGQSDV